VYSFPSHNAVYVVRFLFHSFSFMHTSPNMCSIFQQLSIHLLFHFFYFVRPASISFTYFCFRALVPVFLRTI
jgi:hypothetical protein